jgi:hypothetical protein
VVSEFAADFKGRMRALRSGASNASRCPTALMLTESANLHISQGEGDE